MIPIRARHRLEIDRETLVHPQMLLPHVGEREMEHLVGHRPVIGDLGGGGRWAEAHPDQAPLVLGSVNLIAVPLPRDVDGEAGDGEFAKIIGDGLERQSAPIEEAGRRRPGNDPG